MYQMMSEFGTPFNDAEMNMLPPGANKPHERMMAESGMESQLLPVIIGAAAGLGAGALVGGTVATVAGIGISSAMVGAGIGGLAGAQYSAGRSAAKAAEKQADAQNDYTEASHKYDVELWNMQRDKIYADREHAVKVIETKARNEGTVAAYKDLVNTQRYNYDLQINQRNQDSLDQQYAKSTDVYNRQLTLNERSEKSAIEDEYRSLEELQAEQRYNINDSYVKFLELEGEMRARAMSGRGGLKGKQASYFKLGQEVAAINAALSGAQIGTESALQEISRDRESADLAAEAQRMLDPGTLPAVPQPIATPTAEFEYPRALGEFDFGPQPVRGVYMSPSAASSQVWGNTINGIAGTLTGGITGAIGLAKSDIELKENIEQVGTSPSGLNIYEWNYLYEPNDRYRGVIAQDLLSKGRQDAVAEMDNGYLGVYYDRIDVNMTRV